MWLLICFTHLKATQANGRKGDIVELFGAMPRKMAKTHGDWMKLICGVCCRKRKDLRNITYNILKLIQDNHYDSYSFDWLPTKLCKGCLKIIQEIDVKKDEASRKLPVIDYDSMRRPGALTRGNPKCSCSFCEIGQLNGDQHILYNKEIRDKPGRPATAPKENDLSGRVLKKCIFIMKIIFPHWFCCTFLETPFSLIEFMLNIT